MSEASLSVSRALTISRTIHNPPCTSFALVVLGGLRVTQAIEQSNKQKINQKDGWEFQIISESQNEKRNRFLVRAKTTLERVLVLDEGLEAETKIEGQLVLADVLLLLGDIDAAEDYATRTLKESHQYELYWGSARCQRLLGSIFSERGRIQQAEQYFEQAIEIFRKCGMRLEYARTLHSYGVTLLEHTNVDQKNYQQGLSFLREARQVFHECGATLDLDYVEHEIAFREET